MKKEKQETRIQFHPGFVAAIHLELRDDQEELDYRSELTLNLKPLSIDLLVMKKRGGSRTKNEIGYFFLGHNIIEYKSPRDALNIDIVYKVMGYATLYKAYGKKVDAVRADDVTITFLRQKKPKELFYYFNQHGMTLTNPYPGIYYLMKGLLFPLQFIVTEELSFSAHPWLGALSQELSEENINEVVSQARKLQEKEDIEMADAVLHVCVAANKQIAEKVKGELRMFQTIRELFADEIKENTEKNIIKMVEILREINKSDQEIAKIISKKFELTADEMRRILRSKEI